MVPGSRSPSGELTCSNCFARYPADQLQSYEGSLVCQGCIGMVKRKARSPWEETTSFPRGPDGLPEPSEEDKLRSRVTQLEYQRRRRPSDLDVLTELAELYQRLRNDLLATEILADIERVKAGQTPLGMRSMSPDEQVVVGAPPIPTPFWEDLGEIFNYPLRGRGAGITLVGGIVFGICFWIADRSLFGYLLTFPVLGYQAHYWFSIIKAAAQGKMEPPDWPDLLDVWSGIALPFLASLACSVVPLIPLIIGMILALTIFDLSWVSGGVVVVLLLFGIFTTPMTYLVYASFNSIGAALNPRFVYGAIGRVITDYIVLFTVLCILTAMLMVGLSILKSLVTAFLPMTFVGTMTIYIGASIAVMYYSIAQARLVGHLYWQASGRLAWFGERRMPRRGLHPAVAILGAGGAGVVALVVLVVLLVLPQIVLGTVMGSGVPFRDGTYLEYSIFDSDWGRSAIRYHIKKVEGGFEIRDSVLALGTETARGAFTVNDLGQFISGTDGGGPIGGDVLGQATQTMLWGPPKTRRGRVFRNQHIVTGHKEWKGWDALKVEDPSTLGTYYFDRETGYLVGADRPGIGQEFNCTLVRTDVPGIEVPPEALE